MATSTATVSSNQSVNPPALQFVYTPIAPVHQPPVLSGVRQILPVQGRALEMLAHAIEYLQDEVAFSSPEDPGLRNNQLEAIDALKGMSRALWFSLPVREPVWRRWFHRDAVSPVVTLPLS